MALEELHQAITEERELLTAGIERISLKTVDHAVWRIGQLAGAALVAVCGGIIVLLLVARRLFAAR